MRGSSQSVDGLFTWIVSKADYPFILADLKLPYNGGSLVLSTFCSVAIKLINVSDVFSYVFMSMAEN